MQRNRIIIALIILAVLSAWSVDEFSKTTFEETGERNCKGYTIIEYGKGINCNGDTVVLEKKGGLQVLALKH